MSSTSAPIGSRDSSSPAGVSPGDRVGVIVPKGADAITAFLGIMKARAAYVPADYTAPAARNRTILADCEVKAAFLAPAVRIDPRQRRVARDAQRCPSVAVFLGETAPAHERRHGDGHVESGDRPCVRAGRRTARRVTSPTFCTPQARPVSRKASCSATRTRSPSWTGAPRRSHPPKTDRFSSHAPFHFDLSVLDIYVPLKHGATICVISEELGKSPKDLARFIEESRLTVWYSTPSILALLAEFGDLANRDCRALRLVLFAGEVFAVKHLREVTRRWPWARYYNLYGPTETNVCTFAEIPLPVPERSRDALSDWVAVRALRREGPRRRGGRRGCAGHGGVAVYRGRVGLPRLLEPARAERARVSQRVTAGAGTTPVTSSGWTPTTATSTSAAVIGW